MSNFFTLSEIVSKNWKLDNASSKIPGKEFATTWANYSIKDIKLWEKIYHSPGVVSLYAAWDPFTEFYIIVHETLKDKVYGIEQYYGKNSQQQVIHRFEEFNISLPMNKININQDFLWLFRTN